jgi:hypothetical protein
MGFEPFPSNGGPIEAVFPPKAFSIYLLTEPEITDITVGQRKSRGEGANDELGVCYR